MASTRFPGKILQPIAAELTLIDLLVDRLCRCRFIRRETLVFLTTDQPSDDALVAHLDSRGLLTYRGSEDNVFLRFRQACERWPSEYFFRVCSDNPFIEPTFLDELVEAVSGHPEVDYISYADVRGEPVITTHLGFFAELISTPSFLDIDIGCIEPRTREHVTPVFYDPAQPYEVHLIPIPEELANPQVRMTVDTPEDLEILKILFDKMPPNFHIGDVYSYLSENPQLLDQMAKQIERHPK